MPNVVTIRRPDVIALIEEAAVKLTGGDKTEAVALGVRLLLDRRGRSGSLFAAHPGSVRVREGVDLLAPAFDAQADVGSNGTFER